MTSRNGTTVTFFLLETRRKMPPVEETARSAGGGCLQGSGEEVGWASWLLGFEFTHAGVFDF